VNYYKNLPQSRPPNTLTCLACVAPDLGGAICYGSTSDIDGSHIQPIAGLNAYSFEVGDPLVDSPQVSICNPLTACTGGIKNLCTTGYTGVVCGQCVFGYYADSGLCLQCPTFRWWTLVLLALVLIGAVGVFISISPWLKGLASLRILFNFLQFSYRLRFFHVSWPVFVLTFFDYIGYVVPNIDFLRPECQVPVATIVKFLVIQSVPIFLLICIAVMWYAQRLARQQVLIRQLEFVTKHQPDHEGSQWMYRINQALWHTIVVANRLWWFTLWCILAAATAVVNVILALFQCCEPEYDPDDDITAPILESDAATDTSTIPQSCCSRLSGCCCNVMTCGIFGCLQRRRQNRSTRSLYGPGGNSIRCCNRTRCCGSGRRCGCCCGSSSKPFVRSGSMGKSFFMADREMEMMPLPPRPVSSAGITSPLSLASNRFGSSDDIPLLASSSSLSSPPPSTNISESSSGPQLGNSENEEHESALEQELSAKSNMCDTKCCRWISRVICRRLCRCCCRPPPRIIDSETEALRIRSR
jgi:hypothetical protein